MFFYALKGIIVIALLTFEPLIQLLHISLVPRPSPPPVCDCLRQLQRRKAWEISSCAVMSDRQTVDTQGAVAVMNLESLPCSISPRGEARGLARHCQYYSLFTTPGMF